MHRVMLSSCLLLTATLVTQAAQAEEASRDRLLVHLTFDEREGDEAADASGSGHPGILAAEPSRPRRTAGRMGGGLAFDGVDDFVEIRAAADLDAIQTDSYTVCAFFKPADAPPVREAAEKAHYGIVNKAGWHAGLRYNDDRTFVFDHWLQTDDPLEPRWSGAGTNGETFAPDRWYHVAGVVDASTRTAKVFVDGVLKGTSPPWDRTNKTRDYGRATWKIGTAAPAAKAYAYPAKGVIDDVRLYGRALSDREIAGLAKAGDAARAPRK
ncbi:MAG: LamG domain-containing protein [Planctomycetia bacterium]